MYETIEKFMGIDSTAEGYDIIVLKKTRKPDHCTLVHRYKNISTATMRRFYRLTSNMMSINYKVAIDWRRHKNIFA